MSIETQIIVLVVVALAFYLFGLRAGKSDSSADTYDEGYSDGWKGRQAEVDQLQVVGDIGVRNLYHVQQALEITNDAVFDLMRELGELPLEQVPEPLRTAYLRAKGLDL